MNSSSSNREEDRRKETNSTSLSSLDSRFNQTLRNVQQLLKGRSFPGKVLISRKLDPLSDSSLRSPDIDRHFSDKDAGTSEQHDDFVEARLMILQFHPFRVILNSIFEHLIIKTIIHSSMEDEIQSNSKPNANSTVNKSRSSNVDDTSRESQKSTTGARATDSARLMKFKKAMSGPTIILGMLIFLGSTSS
ncbi:hypothetical protein Acr_08g0011500 [Actinidia rufa]|uniref:Uncharacterized protein n=1 Tax=Actinidia rufa TaxID=165716 RepID=A0A7J0F248_9ERIC|nr:hypothetical protein Acr_08g0011500 [Actinidia rufa]